MEQCNSTHQRHKFPGVLNLFSRLNGKWQIVKFGTGSWLSVQSEPRLRSGGRAALQPGVHHSPLSPWAPWDESPEPGEGFYARAGKGLGLFVSRRASEHLNLLPTRVSPRHLCSEAHSPYSPQVNWGARACNTYNKVSVDLPSSIMGASAF